MKHTTKGEIDVGSLRSILGRIKDAAQSLRNVKTKAGQIEKLADGIRSDGDQVETNIAGLLAQAESLLSQNRAS